MAASTKEQVAQILLENVPSDLVMAIQDALSEGARQGFIDGQRMDPGHRKAMIGQNRYFFTNQLLHTVFEQHDAFPTPLKSNQIIIGRAGHISLACYHADNILVAGKRSTQRRMLAEINQALSAYLNPDLYDEHPPLTDIACFFISTPNPFYQEDGEQDVLSRLQIAVPDPSFSHWLLIENVSSFLERYETHSIQTDNAFAMLKKGVVTKDTQEEAT